MHHFGGGFGGNFSQRIPFPNGSGASAVSNGLNTYMLLNMGLHFLTVVAVLLLVFYIIKRITKHPSPLWHRPDKALELLNERFARGEIDSEEYITRKKVLGYKTE